MLCLGISLKFIPGLPMEFTASFYSALGPMLLFAAFTNASKSVPMQLASSLQSMSNLSTGVDCLLQETPNTAAQMPNVINKLFFIFE